MSDLPSWNEAVRRGGQAGSPGMREAERAHAPVDAPGAAEAAEEPDRPAPQVLVSRPERGRRERLREALLCPFCRDHVERGGGAVVCRRRGCGAIYHRECWAECRAGYGGCAVLGCGCGEARELSAVGYALRLLRLLLAVVLFPPRVLRAMRRHEGAGALSVFRQALARARSAHSWWNLDGGRQSALVLLVGVPLSFAILIPLASYLQHQHHLDAVLVAVLLLGVALAFPFTLLLAPFAAAFGFTAGLGAARVAARALRGEVAALARADRVGGYLARLREGGGKKGA